MTVNRDTEVCISIAERPGSVGSVMFNAAFEALSLNFMYKPFKVKRGAARAAVAAIRTLDIRGCGVSMPHKTSVLRFLDRVDTSARAIGAVNTIVNRRGTLVGYNTDCEGAIRAIRERYDATGKTVLVVGAGGAARAAIVASKRCGARRVFVTNRHDVRAARLARALGVDTLAFRRRHNFHGDLLINATSVGMAPDADASIVEPAVLAPFEAVMDVVVSPPHTKLTSAARALGKVVIPGYEMTLYQAVTQFKLYTGVDAPLPIMRSRMEACLGVHTVT